MQCQPVVAHGVLYATSPKLRVFALDAATGTEKWSFNPLEGDDGPEPDPHPRPDVLGARQRPPHLLRRTALAVRARCEHGKAARRLRAARPHRPAPGLRGTRPARAQRRRQHARRVLRRPADPRLDRAGRAAVGARRHPRLRRRHRRPDSGPSTRSRIPASSATTPGRRTPGRTQAAPTRGPASSLDEKRGLVFAATGSAAYDFYGGNRHGDNLFANTILCLRAATGERVWHFQGVKHDVWDRDFPAPPVARHHQHGRPPASTSSRRSRRTAAPTCSIARPASRSSRWKRSRCRPRTCQARSSSPTQVLPDAAAAVHAAAVHRGSDHQAHARGGERRARGVAEAAQGRRVRPAKPAGHDPVSRHGRRRRMGRRGVRPGARGCSTSTPTRWRGGEARRAQDARRQADQRQGAVPDATARRATAPI